MNPSNIGVSCSGCEFYENGVCENFDGEYFLWEMGSKERCPDFLQKREEGYSIREIIEHLEKS